MLWTGGISLSNWIGGIGFEFSKTGTFTLSKTLLHQFTKNVVDPIAKLAVLRVFAVSLLPSVLLGLIIYNMIRYRDVISIRNLEVELRNTLPIIGESKLSSEFSKQYEFYLKELVELESNPEIRLSKAINKYLMFLVDVVFPRLINSYIKIYKENNINIDFVKSYQALADLNLIRHPALRNARQISDLLDEVIAGYVKDVTVQKKLIKKLDDHVINSIQNAFISEGFFSNLIDYFKNPRAAKYGSLLISFMALSDIAIGSIIHGLGTSAIYGSLVTLYGATIASLSTALLPLAIVVFGYAVYRSIDVSKTRNILLMAREVDILSRSLKVKLPESLIESYNKLLNTKCAKLDKKLRAECALIKYIDVFTDKIYIPIIGAFLRYAEDKYNIDKREISSLFRLVNSPSLVSGDDIVVSFRKLYHYYETIIQILLDVDKNVSVNQYRKINNFLESVK